MCSVENLKCAHFPKNFQKNFSCVIDPLFRPPLKCYIKGGYGRGEGVYPYCHSYLPPLTDWLSIPPTFCQTICAAADAQAFAKQYSTRRYPQANVDNFIWYFQIDLYAQVINKTMWITFLEYSNFVLEYTLILYSKINLYDHNPRTTTYQCLGRY